MASLVRGQGEDINRGRSYVVLVCCFKCYACVALFVVYVACCVACVVWCAIVHVVLLCCELFWAMSVSYTHLTLPTNREV